MANEFEPEQEASRPEKAPSSGAETWREIFDWVQTLVSALVCTVLIFMFVARVIEVDGSSMNYTLYDHDKVIISNLFYTPQQGDIVVFTKKSYGDIPLIKRVIATENQTVDIDFETGDVWVDGVLLDEGYIAAPTHLQSDVDFPVTVPEGCIFVMGDNRNRSSDSRVSRIGMVDKRCVLGKVYLKLYPFNDIKFLG